jgi:hypothetical protein
LRPDRLELLTFWFVAIERSESKNSNLFGFSYEKVISLFFLPSARRLHEKYVVDSIGNLPHASQFTTRTRPINKVVGLIVPRAISSMPVYCAELHVLLETAGKSERAVRIENNADRNFKDLEGSLGA